MGFFDKVKKGTQKFLNKAGSGLNKSINFGNKVVSGLKKVAPLIDQGIDFAQSTGITSIVPGLDLGLDTAQAVGRAVAGAASQGERLLNEANKYQKELNTGDYKALVKRGVSDYQATAGGGPGASTIEKRENRAALSELPNYSEDLFM